ncbi:MAG: hypothetical protein QOC73_494 [Actinomycetota bacterium]|nr:hypothetical protein [Actinomycetota bacterium]
MERGGTGGAGGGPGAAFGSTQLAFGVTIQVERPNLSDHRVLAAGGCSNRPAIGQ